MESAILKSIFQVDCLFVVELQMVFIYSRYYVLIRSVIWKYHPQILLVRFLLCALVTQTSLNGCFDARALPQQLLHPPS